MSGNHRNTSRNVQHRKKKKKKNRIWNLFHFLLEILLLVLLAAILFCAYKNSRMTKVHLKWKEIKKCTTLSDTEKEQRKKYRTLPVILVDGENERMEDIMLIASIEKETGTIRFASIDTECWLTDTDGYENQISDEYEVNGAGALVSLLNQNLELDMEDYIILKSCILPETVNHFGGIDIELDKKETESVNELLRLSSQTPISGSGKQHLTGEQVMAYCRNAYSEKHRMDRLADVAWKLLLRTEQEQFSGINHVTDECLYHITTSLSMIDCAMMVKELLVYEIAPYGIMPKDITEHPGELCTFLYS